MDAYGDASIRSGSPTGRIGGRQVNADGFDLGLTELRKELHELANAATNADGEPLQGYGEAADGMVRVTAVEGRLSTVDLNPRVMRLASQELAEAFAEAANAALADLASKFPQTTYPAVDIGTLETQLAEAQQQATLQIRRFDQTINDALRHSGL
jgi:hypothetical protein